MADRRDGRNNDLDALMWEGSPCVLDAKFVMVLELQAIKFENANFLTKMDFLS